MVDYNAELRKLLAERSVELHKAGSVRHTFEDDARERQAAAHRTNAERLTYQIVDLIVEHFPDQRPLPQLSFEYNDQRYVLNEWDGITAKYVVDTTTNKGYVAVTLRPYRDFVLAQISRH
jgi:hypothetical protein